MIDQEITKEQPNTDETTEQKSPGHPLRIIIGVAFAIVTLTGLIYYIYHINSIDNGTPTPTPQITPNNENEPRTEEQIRNELVEKGFPLLLTDELTQVLSGYDYADRQTYLLTYRISPREHDSALNIGAKYKKILVQDNWQILNERSNNCSLGEYSCTTWFFLNASKTENTITLNTDSSLGFTIELNLAEISRNNVPIEQSLVETVLRDLKMRNVFNNRTDQGLHRQIVFVDGDLPEMQDHLQTICNFLNLDIKYSGIGSSIGAVSYGCTTDHVSYLKVFTTSSDFLPTDSIILDYQH
ncbi:hypothetical protein KJ596_01840 [Patescibacteria group bacterium]|nr:hypothetical protein [Patescibacteria group bacterium]MBU1868207.1 hypothetical protein [Patescibacteria group bacterium]